MIYTLTIEHAEDGTLIVDASKLRHYVHGQKKIVALKAGETLTLDYVDREIVIRHEPAKEAKIGK